MTKLSLVVDDSGVVRKFARRMLQELGFAVEEAADGREALARCGTMPDVILLDWNMPVMNGIEFLRMLRQQPQGGKPVVLFCTTEGEFERIAQAVEAGANEYIIKPFDREVLASKLQLTGVIA